MTGTLINIVTVLVGGTIGLTFGDRLPSRVKETVMGGLGLFTLAIGVQMFLNTTNPVIVLLSLLFGGLLGEWWQIELGLQRFGAAIEAIGGKDNRLGHAPYPHQSGGQSSNPAPGR